mmetsp:Transcript_23788/g.35660  ORF Transcript_23788/g.35660 Transcript_23788/m.35660 type:complete len:273 (+) Transcript_23788:606-1424(+)
MKLRDKNFLSRKSFQLAYFASIIICKVVLYARITFTNNFLNCTTFLRKIFWFAATMNVTIEINLYIVRMVSYKIRRVPSSDQLHAKTMSIKKRVVSQNFYPNFLNLNKQILFLYGEVNDTIADIIIKNVIYLNSSSKKQHLTLMINSPGGSVTSGLAMYDSFNLVDLDVGTTCIALAASMGAFLLASGFKGKRNGFNHCRIMIHQPLGGIVGSFNQVENQANELLYYKLVLNSYLSSFSSQSTSKIMRDCDRDYFMSSKEALDYGLIDNILN